MKVAIVCPYDWSFPGGVKTHITGLTGALRKAGHDVQIMAPASKPEPDIFVAGKPLGIAFNGSVARVCFSPGAKARVGLRLAGEGFDVVHIHEPAAPSIGFYALRAAIMPAVATFHASAERNVAYRAAGPVLRPFIQRLSSRIAVSTAARSLASSVFPGDYRIIPNGVETGLFVGAKPQEELAAKRPLVVFVGRPEPRKGLDVLIEAMEILRSKMKAELAVVGPPQAKVPSWVKATGPLDSAGLAGVLAAADVFCAPSLKGESFGIVLVEAMAAGVPVVCSDLPGYKEAAAGAAVHVRAGDAAGVARALAEVLTDQQLASDLIERGNKRAAELDWKVLAEDVLDCYRRAIS